MLTNLPRRHPENRFLLDHADEFAHASQLPPNQFEYEGDHHRQAQRSLAKTQRVKMRHLRQRGWMDEILNPVLDRLICGRRDRMLATLPLNGARMSNTALFPR